jgi:sugar lactone lactonase YvrE
VVSTDAITDGLTFDVNGNLYAAQTNLGSVLQIHLDGSERTYATGLQHPGAMSSDPSGNLYVVTGQTQYGEQVISVAPDGQQSVFTTDVDGIYWANEGHVYIGTWGGTITLTTPSGTTTTLATGLSDPDPLALTAAGDLYFWDARDEMVGELAPDGSVVSVTTTPNAYSVAVAVPEPESLLAVCLPVVAVNIRDRRRRARPSLTVRTDIPF